LEISKKNLRPNKFLLTNYLLQPSCNNIFLKSWK